MALDLSKIKALAAAEEATGKDLNVQQSGGDYTPPAEGVVRLRFVSYVELGVHTSRSAMYGDKTKARARFGFELSGPKHPPKDIDGKKYPHLVFFEEPIGTGAKNNYSKLFKAMVKDYPAAKNFVALLGEAFRGKVSHRKYKVGDQERVSAELKTKETGYSITGTLYEDEESGEVKRVKVDAPLTALQAFLWDHADVEQWDSIYVGGQYDDGGSKNKLQEKIKTAENFIGSAIYDALIEAGREAEIEPATKGEPVADPDVPQEDAEAEDPPVQETPEKAPAKAVAPPKKEVKGKAPVAAKTAQKPVKRAEPVETDDDPLSGL